nr:DNA translocase FtsK [Clostridia bacterium]
TTEVDVDNKPDEWSEFDHDDQPQLEVLSLDQDGNEEPGEVQPPEVLDQKADNQSAEMFGLGQDNANQPVLPDAPLPVMAAQPQEAKTGKGVELAVQPQKTSLPAIALLAQGRRSGLMPFTDDILEKASLLEETLANFGVRAQVTDFTQGPTITRFEVQPAPGVKVSRIVSLADDIALALAAADVRIEAPIPGKAAVGIEVPNRELVSVSLREVLESKLFAQARSKLSVVLGKDIGGEPVVADLVRMPHLLIAGSTGSGKSVCMNSLIISLLYKARPHEVKFLMIDPKIVELSTYNGIPHLIAPVITDPKQATAALRWVVTEMENRYNLFAQTGVKNLESYNELQKAAQGHVLPLVVVLIDELADLMMVASREVEEAICRLAQMARAAGIHLVIATQRPSVDVITGIIKANIPSRIAFAVSSQVDSRTILDMAGAEKLLGRGDMLFSPIGAPKSVRVQGAFVSDEEVEKVVGFWKSQGKPEYLEGVLRPDTNRTGSEQQEDEDELLPAATKLIIECGQASVSMLQRRFRIGYTRAARLIDLMQEKGFIGGYEGSKPREVLVSKEEWQEIFG